MSKYEEVEIFISDKKNDLFGVANAGVPVTDSVRTNLWNAVSDNNPVKVLGYLNSLNLDVNNKQKMRNILLAILDFEEERNKGGMPIFMQSKAASLLNGLPVSGGGKRRKSKAKSKARRSKSKRSHSKSRSKSRSKSKTRK